MKTRYPPGLLLSVGCALVAACILLGGCTPQRSYALQYDGVDDQADCGDAETRDITDRIY